MHITILSLSGYRSDRAEPWWGDHGDHHGSGITYNRQSFAKMFWKTSLDLPRVILQPFPHFFPPFSHINVGYFDDFSSCNTETTFFNIDVGIGGRSVHIYP